MIFGIIFLFFDFRVTLGVLLGYAFSLLHQRFLEYRMDAVLKNREVTSWTYFGNILSLLLLAVPLLIPFLLPQVFHWAGALIGLLYRKYYLYISAFFEGGNRL